MRKLDGVKIATEIANSRKGRCLSTDYRGIDYKLLWECEKGHQWYAALSDIKKRNGWCSICSGKKKLTIEFAQKEAEKRGGKCLSDIYLNNKSKLKWQCNKGHIWKASFTEIKNKESWCPYCNRGVITLEDLKNLAVEKKGECLSNSYNYYKKLLWRCNYGHEWWATAANIKDGKHWCPECGRIEAAKKMRYSYKFNHWKTGKEIVCVGSYEANVVCFLNKNKIDFLWQPKTFQITSKKTYRPDLYLIEKDKWIEIKGHFWNDSKEKWNWFHTNFSNSDLWNEKKLKEMKII